jgi:hypothetical protein
MSLRASPVGDAAAVADGRATPSHCGSLYGPAVGHPVGGLWARLAVSPPRSPPLEAAAGFAPVPALELGAPSGNGSSSEVPTLQAVCPTWSYAIAEQAALVLFSEAAQSTTMPIQSHPRRLHIRDPVALKTIAASSLAWKPMRDPETGRTGVIFLLGSEQGAVDFKGAARSAPRDGGELAETRVEVNVDGHGELERVAVVQSDYFPLAVAAGVADASSLLVYEQPEAHLQSLRALRESLRAGSDPELGYVPTAELCVTPGFDRLLLRNNPRASGEDNDAARRAWRTTKQFLKTLSGLTADCVDAYTFAELTRTHAHELSHEYQRWRGSVV